MVWYLDLDFCITTLIQIIKLHKNIGVSVSVLVPLPRPHPHLCDSLRPWLSVQLLSEQNVDKNSKMSFSQLQKFCIDFWVLHIQTFKTLY
jgi:hypothetical protein